MSRAMIMHQFEVVGRKKPIKDEEEPKVYRMRLFAANQVMARSRFWYYLRKLKKVKVANGEILSTKKIFEKTPNKLKNFGMWIRYDSRSGTHNMYKEYRDTHVTAAVAKMYTDLASRHRARKSSIQIVNVKEIPSSQCKRPGTTQFHDSKIKFHLLHRIPLQSKKFKKKFAAKAPSTFF